MADFFLGGTLAATIMSENVTRPRLYRIGTISVRAKELTLSRFRPRTSSHNREIGSESSLQLCWIVIKVDYPLP